MQPLATRRTRRVSATFGFEFSDGSIVVKHSASFSKLRIQSKLLQQEPGRERCNIWLVFSGDSKVIKHLYHFPEVEDSKQDPTTGTRESKCNIWLQV